MTARALTAKTIDLVALVKPRIMMLSLVTAAGAMRLAPAAIPFDRAILLLVGCALIVGAASTLNMYLERDVDCLMARTKNRPLPRQSLSPTTALAFGAVQGALALPVLALSGIVPAALGLLALLLYVGVYTPMKQRTHWAVWIGAVPGAMPALMGWTAATGRIDVAGLAVFGVLFFWQIPHTHAIGIYRQREYHAAGMKTLPGTHGVAAARRAILVFLVVQVAISLAPTALGVTGTLYLATAIGLGVLVLAQGIRGPKVGEGGMQRWARSVFVTSIVYLPVLFTVMVLNGRA